MKRAWLIFGAIVVLGVLATAQDQAQPSLADVARQQRTKDKEKPAKVFTNDNLPQTGEVSTGTGRAPGVEPPAPSSAADSTAKTAASAKPGAKGKVDEEKVKAAQAKVAKWQKELKDLGDVKAKAEQMMASEKDEEVQKTYQHMLDMIPAKYSAAQQNLADAEKELQAAQAGETSGAAQQAPPAEGQAPPQQLPAPEGQAPPADNSNPQ